MIQARYDEFTQLMATLLDNSVLDLMLHFEGPVIRADEDSRGVVLRGKANVLSGGAMPKLIDRPNRDWPTLVYRFHETRAVVTCVIDCPQPAVSAMESAALGGVLAMTLLADFPIAGKTTGIADPHVRIGIATGEPAAMSWPLLCGLANVTRYLLTGTSPHGEDAERIGLLSIAGDDEALAVTATQIATRLATISSDAVDWSHYAPIGCFRMPLPIFDSSLELELFTLQTPDASGVGRSAQAHAAP